MLLPVILTSLFFAVLLVSGARVFGVLFGTPMRGAVLPLVAIPLATDWCRYLFALSPATALGVCTLIYLIVAAVYFLVAKPEHPFIGMAPAVRRNWWLCLAILVVVHIGIRTWIFTGSVPNPADDVWSGYKCGALLHTKSWPTTMTDEPELGMSYYYYGWEWPAALESWVSAPPQAGWWVTAIILCVAGGMLAIELFLPRLRNAQTCVRPAWRSLADAQSVSFFPLGWAR